MGDAGLSHDEPEEVLHRVLIRLHRLPVLEVVQEDIVRVQLDRRLADLRVHGDLVANVVEREVSGPPQGDFAELAAAAASSHDLVHRMHRRPQDLRNLVDRGGRRVREAHDGGSRIVDDPIENLRDQMVDLAVDDEVDHLVPEIDRKSTRLNSSHLVISYAVFCLKKKKTQTY